MIDFSLPTREEISKQVELEVAPTAEEKALILSDAKKKTSDIMTLDITSYEQRKTLVEVIDTFGEDVMKEAYKKNGILESSILAFGESGGELGLVAKNLELLTTNMKELDPEGIDFTSTGLLSKLFNPAKKYFERFEHADDEIGRIIEDLDRGKKMLANDNITIELEQDALRAMTKKVTAGVEMGMQLEACISDAIEKARMSGENPERILFVEQELLFPLRDKLIDFQQLAVINQQGIVALDFIRRNNKEMIRAAERAKMISIKTLGVAVSLASAMYNEKIALKKISALNDKTNQMLRTTSSMYREQMPSLKGQASASEASIEGLKRAFADTMEALNDINTYRAESLPNLRSTIWGFKELVAEGEKQIQLMEEADS